METEWHQHGDERQQVDVLNRGRQPLIEREQRVEDMKPDEVRDHERRHPEHGVRDEMKQDEEPVVADHRAGPSDRDESATSACISSPNRSRPKRSAWRRITPASNRCVRQWLMASANAAAVGSWTRTP